MRPARFPRPPFKPCFFLHASTNNALCRRMMNFGRLMSHPRGTIPGLRTLAPWHSVPWQTTHEIAPARPTLRGLAHEHVGLCAASHLRPRHAGEAERVQGHCQLLHALPSQVRPPPAPSPRPPAVVRQQYTAAVAVVAGLATEPKLTPLRFGDKSTQFGALGATPAPLRSNASERGLVELAWAARELFECQRLAARRRQAKRLMVKLEALAKQAGLHLRDNTDWCALPSHRARTITCTIASQQSHLMCLTKCCGRHLPGRCAYQTMGWCAPQAHTARVPQPHTRPCRARRLPMHHLSLGTGKNLIQLSLRATDAMWSQQPATHYYACYYYTNYYTYY
jgi:hypothetical protein